MCVFYTLCVRVNRSAVRKEQSKQLASLGKWNPKTRHRHDSRLMIDRTHAREVSDSVVCVSLGAQEEIKKRARVVPPDLAMPLLPRLFGGGFHPAFS